MMPHEECCEIVHISSTCARSGRHSRMFMVYKQLECESTNLHTVVSLYEFLMVYPPWHAGDIYGIDGQHS
jgi:hypothetical protein